MKTSKHQLRTTETRKLLLKAAQAIFARDGFEGAELGEIATMAGRSKGAIYGHFKSKEDLFFALFEEQIAIYTQRADEAFKGRTSQKELSRAVADFYFALLSDKAWLRLSTEFRVFSIRNKSSKKRVQKIYKTMYGDDLPEQWTFLAQKKSKDNRTLGRQTALFMIAPMLCGLGLEQEFAPEIFTDAKLKEATTMLIETFLFG